MSDLDIVITTCRRLFQDGKTPTSALIKFNLPHPVPFPTIISGLQFWQQLDTKDKGLIDISQDNNKKVSNYIETNDNGLIKTLSDQDFLQLKSTEQTLYLKKILETTIFQLTNEISILKKEINNKKP